MEFNLNLPNGTNRIKFNGLKYLGNKFSIEKNGEKS